MSFSSSWLIARQQLTAAKDKLRQKISSVDVTDKLFEIADAYSVNVTIMGTTSIAQEDYRRHPLFGHLGQRLGGWRL